MVLTCQYKSCTTTAIVRSLLVIVLALTCLILDGCATHSTTQRSFARGYEGTQLDLNDVGLVHMELNDYLIEVEKIDPDNGDQGIIVFNETRPEVRLTSRPMGPTLLSVDFMELRPGSYRATYMDYMGRYCLVDGTKSRPWQPNNSVTGKDCIEEPFLKFRKRSFDWEIEAAKTYSCCAAGFRERELKQLFRRGHPRRILKQRVDPANEYRFNAVERAP